MREWRTRDQRKGHGPRLMARSSRCRRSKGRCLIKVHLPSFLARTKCMTSLSTLPRFLIKSTTTTTCTVQAFRSGATTPNTPRNIHETAALLFSPRHICPTSRDPRPTTCAPHPQTKQAEAGPAQKHNPQPSSYVERVVIALLGVRPPNNSGSDRRIIKLFPWRCDDAPPQLPSPSPCRC